MAHNFKEIGSRIEEARTKAGLTQAHVAERLGYMQYQTVLNWEKGKVIPTTDVLLKLCDIFGCDLGYLVGEYPCMKLDISMVYESLGLSQDAIQVLQGMKALGNGKELELLNELILFTANYPSCEPDKKILLSAIAELVSFISLGNGYDAMEKGYMWEIQELFMDFIKCYLRSRYSKKKQGG